MNTDTDRKPPTLTLFDATGSPGTEFLLADTDSGPPAERLPFLYVTIGAAMDLPAIWQEVPGANAWEIDTIIHALAPLPLNSRCTVNDEYFNGKDGWTLDQFVCAFARLVAARPDIEWALYSAHEHRHPNEFGATLPFTSFIVDSVYPGVYADRDLRLVERLIRDDPNAIILTGWVRAVGGGQSWVEPTEAEVRDIMRRLFKMGVTNLGIWMGPNKPGTRRYPERILQMAKWAQEEFDLVHRPDADTEPGVAS